jgi:Zn-dependent M28 family amino/carboxypeptidase
LAKNRLAAKRKYLIPALALALLTGAISAASYSLMSMPGCSYKGPFAELSAQEKDSEQHLRKNVDSLAAEIGQRNTAESLNKSIQYIESELASYGYKTEEQEFIVDNQKFKNLECTLKGESPEVLLVGGHYDSVLGSIGADDNGSGVAATMELARMLARKKLSKTVKFVFFCNEEPPYFASEKMGSYFYLQRCLKNQEKISALIVLETLGYYVDRNNSQFYPTVIAPGYPSKGNFIAFVGNLEFKNITERCVGLFRKDCNFPSEGIAAPGWVEGIDWSDQYWFWKNGIPAVMVTDTALYRYPHYHTMQDTPDKLNFPAFSRVVVGMSKVIENLAQ